MEEIRSGSHADNVDISKTFDNDETFDKVKHRCAQGPDVLYLKPGTRCSYCGAEILKLKGG